MARQVPLVFQHLENISRTAVEEYQEIIREYVRGKQGIYALYRRGKLYYVEGGLASPSAGAWLLFQCPATLVGVLEIYYVQTHPFLCPVGCYRDTHFWLRFWCAYGWTNNAVRGTTNVHVVGRWND